MNYEFMWVGKSPSDKNAKPCFKFDDNKFLIEDSIMLDEVLPFLLKYSYAIPTLINDIQELHDHFGSPDEHLALEIIDWMVSDPLKLFAPDDVLIDFISAKTKHLEKLDIHQSQAVQKIFLRALNKNKNNEELYIKKFSKLQPHFPILFYEKNLDAPEFSKSLWGASLTDEKLFLFLTSHKKLPKKFDELNFHEFSVDDPTFKEWEFLLSYYPNNKSKLNHQGLGSTLIEEFFIKFKSKKITTLSHLLNKMDSNKPIWQKILQKTELNKFIYSMIHKSKMQNDFIKNPESVEKMLQFFPKEHLNNEQLHLLLNVYISSKTNYQDFSRFSSYFVNNHPEIASLCVEYFSNRIDNFIKNNNNELESVQKAQEELNKFTSDMLKKLTSTNSKTEFKKKKL